MSRRSSSSWQNQKDKINHAVAALTSRAAKQLPCPFSVEQMQDMLVPPERVALLQEACAYAPEYFKHNSDGSRGGVTVRIVDDKDGTVYQAKLTMPAAPYSGKYDPKRRMLLPSQPVGGYEFREGADPAMVQQFLAWAIERHKTGLRISYTRRLVAYLLEKAKNVNQIHKLWPILLECVSVEANGHRAQWPDGVKIPDFEQPIKIANTMLAMCALLDKQDATSDLAISGAVSWDKTTRTPWDNRAIEAE